MVVAPSTAGAFVGESHVINPSTGKLTTPAETIITNPTFLETFEDAAPAPQKQGLLRTLMGSRALPMIGRLLPAIGVGFAAFEICNAVMSGCLSFSDSGDSGYGAGAFSWEWTNRSKTSNGAVSHSMIYVYSPAARVFDGEIPEDWTCTTNAVPDGVTSWGASAGSVSQGCGPKGATVTVPRHWAERWPESWSVNYAGGEGSTALGSSKYCNGWGASDSCQTSPDTSGWSAAAATGLKEHVEPEVGQWVAAQIEGSGVADPYATTVDVPDCGAYLWGECAEKLEEAGLEPSRVKLDWETAVLTKPADAVLETEPAGGAIVETGSKVTVTTNPEEAGMPFIIPAPESGETYDEYAARVTPTLDPSRVTVGADFYDPSTGPDGVIRTVPESGTRANPATETEVDVHTNPSDAPPATPMTWTAPPVSSIDLSPLSAVAIGCNDFPFGIFCWIGSGLTAWGPGGECPQLGVPFGSSIGLDDELAFDTCLFEPAMEIVRPVLILLAAFSLAYFFAAAAMGLGGGGGDD